MQSLPRPSTTWARHVPCLALCSVVERLGNIQKSAYFLATVQKKRKVATCQLPSGGGDGTCVQWNFQCKTFRKVWWALRYWTSRENPPSCRWFWKYRSSNSMHSSDEYTSDWLSSISTSWTALLYSIDAPQPNAVQPESHSRCRLRRGPAKYCYHNAATHATCCVGGHKHNFHPAHHEVKTVCMQKSGACTSQSSSAALDQEGVFPW